MSSTAGSSVSYVSEQKRFIEDFGAVTLFGGIPLVSAIYQAFTTISMRRFDIDPFQMALGFAFVFFVCLLANLGGGVKSNPLVRTLVLVSVVAGIVMYFKPGMAHREILLMSLIGVVLGGICLVSRTIGWGWLRKGLLFFGSNEDLSVDEEHLNYLKQLDIEESSTKPVATTVVDDLMPADKRAAEIAATTRFAPTETPAEGVGYDPKSFGFPSTPTSDELGEDITAPIEADNIVALDPYAAWESVVPVEVEPGTTKRSLFEVSAEPVQDDLAPTAPQDQNLQAWDEIVKSSGYVSPEVISEEPMTADPTPLREQPVPTPELHVVSEEELPAVPAAALQPTAEELLARYIEKFGSIEGAPQPPTTQQVAPEVGPVVEAQPPVHPIHQVAPQEQFEPAHVVSQEPKVSDPMAGVAPAQPFEEDMAPAASLDDDAKARLREILRQARRN